MKINHDVKVKSSFGKAIKNFLGRRDPWGYGLNRFEWHYFPRFRLLRRYPLHVDIELSSFCQLKCPMCFRYHRPVERTGNMDIVLFRKIIDEISGKVYSIKFTGRGEPLINRDIISCLQYLKGRKFGEVSIITNGQYLDEKVAEAIIDAKIDRVAFSIDGLEDEYERIRRPIKYGEIKKIVTGLYEMRRRRGMRSPLIRIQGVKSSITEEREFLDTWDPISDEILFLVYKDYSSSAGNDEQSDYPCPLMYQRMMIHFDGTVPMCINDEYEDSVMGDLKTSTVDKIWSGEKFTDARKVHNMKIRHKVYDNCSKCALHRVNHGKQRGG